jgi:diguanylate cyclase (GGDEF)-like protein
LNIETKNYSKLDVHKIDALISQAQVAMSMGTVAAAIIFLVYWNLSIKCSITIWFGIYLLIYLLRIFTVKKYNSSQHDKRNYILIMRFHIISSAVVGLLWSAISIYLFYIYNTFESLYILLVLGGLVAGAVATNIILMSVYYSFVLPATLPIIIFLLTHNSNQLNMSGIILSLFVIFITSSAYRLNKLVSDSLSYQFENLQLLDDLEQEKIQVTRLYTNLESDLAKRKKAEKLLILEKEKAEELARSLLTISTLDGLTGIPNRRHFDSILAKEWNRASRSKTAISLIMSDIDYFKPYNDHYGHQKGDNCLMQVANLLQELARRDDDMAARYGGEEFAVILPTTTIDNAKEIAEQMRLAILELCIPHKHSLTDNIVTVSFGVATVIPKREQPSNILVSFADKALYKAKQQGHNRVVEYMRE